MYTTPHAKMRFLERVKCNGMPIKHRDKFIENYIKKAYNDGLTPKEIDDKYLKDYMNNKLKDSGHYVKCDKIDHYKSNLFLFSNRHCITILEVPNKAIDLIDDVIYITKLHPFVNQLKESKRVKNYLHDYGNYVENIKDLKRCIVNYPRKMNYDWLMNKFPMRAILYVKNDSDIKKIIIKVHKHRPSKNKELYNFIYALLLIFPKNQILKLQTLLNNKKSIFKKFSNKNITTKQIELCYKQLFILLNGQLTPKYNNFKVINNSCIDLVNDHLNNIIEEYIKNTKKIFKDFS